MRSNRQKLADFLRASGCLDVEGALSPLTRLFDFAKLNEYPLWSPNEINQPKLRKVVALATGRPVSKIAFICLSNPCLKPEWMTQELFKASLRSCTEYSFGHSLLASLGSDLRESLDYKIWANISTYLAEGLGYALSVNIIGAGLWDNIGGSIKESLWNCLHSYLGSCLINDQEKIKALRLLVEFWSVCLILGFKDDEPETLIVVCH